jgi:integrase
MSIATMAPADATSLRPERIERDSKVPGLQLRHGSTRSCWYLYFRLHGREHRPKIGDARIMKRPQARQIALQWLSDVAQGRHPHRAPDRRSMADLRTRYDEVHSPRKKPASREADARLWDRHILPALGRLEVAKVTRADINELHHAMRATPYQANRAVSLLHKAFSLAIGWGWGADNPAAVERYREQRRRRVPSSAEIMRILDALEAMRTAQPWFVGMVELIAFTGCRRREIQNARHEWVRDGALHLPDSKTGAKVVPLNEPARAALARIPRIVGNPHIICGRSRGPLVGHFKLWQQLLAAAGVSDLRVHDLRRLFASVSLSAGVQLDQVGQVLGHASITTTRGYAYLQQDAARLASEAAGAVFVKLRTR